MRRRWFALPLQQGFTLLELLLVVSILAGISTLALDVVSGQVSQQRFSTTGLRLAQIRAAILPQQAAYSNDATALLARHYFFLDMGRLPNCLAELLNPLDCDDEELPAYGINAVTGVGVGWRGPYLYPSHYLADGSARYTDGWGNDDGGVNHGWQWSLNDGALQVSSLGLDGVVSSGQDDVYENDYPPAATALINANDYHQLVYDGSSGRSSLVFYLQPRIWGQCLNDTDGDGVLDPVMAFVDATMPDATPAVFSSYTSLSQCEGHDATNTWQPLMTSSDANIRACVRVFKADGSELETDDKLDIDPFDFVWNGTEHTFTLVLEGAVASADIELPNAWYQARIYAWDALTNSCLYTDDGDSSNDILLPVEGLDFMNSFNFYLGMQQLAGGLLWRL